MTADDLPEDPIYACPDCGVDLGNVDPLILQCPNCGADRGLDKDLTLYQCPQCGKDQDRQRLADYKTRCCGALLERLFRREHPAGPAYGDQMSREEIRQDYEAAGQVCPVIVNIARQLCLVA